MHLDIQPVRINIVYESGQYYYNSMHWKYLYLTLGSERHVHGNPQIPWPDNHTRQPANHWPHWLPMRWWTQKLL